MRYQERIYIQNEYNGVRNKDMLNVNMSSDFCIFQSPRFDISGATKVNCDSITCNLSGYTGSTILSAATSTCLSGLSTSSCLTATTWQTRIYENTELAYSADFYTTNITGDTPSDNLFYESVTGALTTLGYLFDLTGTTLFIDKKPSVGLLDIDVCVLFGIAPSTIGCPAGYSATPANDGCQQILETGATFNGSGGTINAGNTDTAYAFQGTRFYPNIQTEIALPLYYLNADFSLRNQTGGTYTVTALNNTAPFWGNPTPTLTNGRLNNVGLSASSTEWLGFTYCVDIMTGGTYYIGLAADNECRFSVDGTLYVQLTGSTGANFQFWTVFPFELTSGRHIIEMEGKNEPASATAFGAEIYFPIDFPTLTGATSTGSSQANVIFSTANFVGQTWEIGDTIGYSCPAGYVLDGCGTAYTCTQIINAAYSGTSCTGATCSENCVEICSESFPYINSGSTGVHLFDSITATTLPLSFNFTSNTSVFSATNASFKFEIYKYDTDLDVFTTPPIYSSDLILYSAFSGTNLIETSVPLSGLSLDGDYLIKGYYEADACTDFLSRLGKKIDTSIYFNGSEYGLYDPIVDFYFIGVTRAEVPTFTQSQVSGISYYEGLALYQDVILIDEYSGSSYTRTGVTFTLTSEYVGDVIVTLNGLALSKDIDYTLSGTILTFIGDIEGGDIITMIYTRTSLLTIVAETIDVATTITSGATGGQGNNKYYYNTTTGKYEIYTNNNPLDFSSLIVILNGVFLSNGIDFYQSITDPNRIILVGDLMVNDIITIVYYPSANVTNGISQTVNIINWEIQTQPQSDNGEFSLQFSSDENFSTYTVSDLVPYQPLVTNYSGILTITGSVGTQLYYRVQNTKSYASICDVIESVADSEIVPFLIQSNAINSY